ncbi:hypothetical protein [Desulfallas thermosapovorans]|uniref:Uncharacterized protein n=1 Tax=Desulfallas thermosapovorans DSM 6562 TaxID=1121431 RepID=A0A5S4ZUZ1_9FIRM|nr:hypothetical protein [Desulfallas thermosapovorans]TYO96531.1 hypothetical protein LX24_01000 [Desulfallas thermosapovorans DSM 6562]
MIIDTDTLLAMRCPECGKLDYHNLSRFSFSGRKRVEIFCSCGYVKLVITSKDRKSFWLQVPCVVCESKHVHSFSSKMLWSERVNYLFCHETGLELGYIGPCDEVKAMAAAQQETMEALADDFEAEDEYFNNSEVMYEVLNCLHDIAEQGSLYCQCGNRDVEVDIFPDRLELHCKDCDSVNIIYAETDDDLRVIREVETIELVRNGFECLDSLSNTTKTGKKPKHRRK